MCLAGRAPHPRRLAVSLGVTLTPQLAARSAGMTTTEAQGSGGLACGGYPRLPERLASPSVMSDSVTPWTVARQAPLSMEFSRPEY